MYPACFGYLATPRGASVWLSADVEHLLALAPKTWVDGVAAVDEAPSVFATGSSGRPLLASKEACASAALPRKY